MPTLHQIAYVTPGTTRIRIMDYYLPGHAPLCGDLCASDLCDGLQRGSYAFGKDWCVLNISAPQEGILRLEIAPPIEVGDEPAGE